MEQNNEVKNKVVVLSRSEIRDRVFGSNAFTKAEVKLYGAEIRSFRKERRTKAGKATASEQTALVAAYHQKGFTKLVDLPKESVLKSGVRRVTFTLEQKVETEEERLIKALKAELEEYKKALAGAVVAEA